MGEGKPIHQFGGSTLSIHGALAASAAEQGGSAPSTPCAIAAWADPAQASNSAARASSLSKGFMASPFAGSG